MWIYALLEGHGLAPSDWGAGLAGEPLLLLSLPEARLRAVVGELDASPEPTAETLRAHDAVVRRVSEAVEAALPVRFGQTCASAGALDAAVAARAKAFAAALTQVRGCAQMTLRVFDPPGSAEQAAPGARPEPPPPDREPPDREPSDREPSDRELGPGARYLAARRARASAAAELGVLAGALAPHVRAERVERSPRAGAGPGLLASVYHLVPRPALAAYRAAVDAGAASLSPRRLTLSGPWPPYAFAP